MIAADVHLDNLANDTRRVGRAFARLTASLGQHELLWRPQPTRWSVADILEHLFATGRVYYPRVRAALDRHTGRRWGKVPYRPTRFGRLFIRLSGPETTVRFRAPKGFVPPPPTPDVPARFLAQQDWLLRLLQDAHGADLRAIKITSPVSRLLTLRLGECLEMLVRHQERHLRQALRVRGEPGFPSPSLGTGAAVGRASEVRFWIASDARGSVESPGTDQIAPANARFRGGRTDTPLANGNGDSNRQPDDFRLDR